MVRTPEGRVPAVSDALLVGTAPETVYGLVADPTAAGSGTRVALTWTDERGWPDPPAAVVDRVVTGGHTFAAFQRRTLATSLAGLKRVAEGVRAG
ncbi:hypothetical protein [Pseudonocardia sp. NPDC049154]|uniref:hypothetical protein n=1 Tax=Pseudonocardia sp. NPDC049154 TaxID=3155501 RepID=UPI0033CBF2D3